jgi:hypothetical protein
VEISHDQAGENCASERAINFQVFPGRVTIRDGTPDIEDDRPVKYQDESQQNEQAPPNQPGPSPRSLPECLTVFIHEGGNLFPRG